MPTSKHKQRLSDYEEEDSLNELAHIFILLLVLVERSGHSLLAAWFNRFRISAKISGQKEEVGQWMQNIIS